jgi:hypothetical protein
MAIGLGLTLGLTGAARAGIYTDDLSKCLVKATTQADRVELMTWIFEAMSAHPAVRSLSTVTDAQREVANRRAAGLMQRLLTEDCRPQTVDAVRYESMGAIQQSFMVLGQVAMGGLMQDPTVAQNMQKLGTYLDGGKFAALAKDAGIAGPPAPK